MAWDGVSSRDAIEALVLMGGLFARWFDGLPPTLRAAITYGVFGGFVMFAYMQGTDRISAAERGQLELRGRVDQQGGKVDTLVTQVEQVTLNQAVMGANQSQTQAAVLDANKKLDEVLRVLLQQRGR